MQVPQYLKKGDTVGILSTARFIDKVYVDNAVSLLESWGLKVRLGKTVQLKQNQFAGTDKERLNDFQEMINQPDIKAILCARGGYGTVRIIDQVDFSTFAKNPKWIIGYSDITVLHNHIHTHFNIPTIHSSMPINFKTNSEEAINSIKQSLFGELKRYVFKSNINNIIGSSEGLLTGGNLSILHTLIGTNSDINTEDKILFIEEVDEYLYHIDRMMIALKRSGKLNKLKGLIVGGMTDIHDNLIPFGKTVEEIILEHTKDFGYPVCFGFPVGHLDDNRAIILGRTTTLKICDTECSLEFQN